MGRLWGRRRRRNVCLMGVSFVLVALFYYGFHLTSILGIQPRTEQQKPRLTVQIASNNPRNEANQPRLPHKPGNEPNQVLVPHAPTLASTVPRPRISTNLQLQQDRVGERTSQPGLTRQNFPVKPRQNLGPGQTFQLPRLPDQFSFQSRSGRQDTDSAALRDSVQHKPTNNAIYFRSQSRQNPLTSSEMKDMPERGLKISHGDQRFNFAEWETVQKERRHRLRMGCAENILKTRGNTVYKTQSIVDEDKRFLYCPVEKSASTFLRRFMYALQHRTNPEVITSPFDVPITTALQYEFVDVRTLYRNGKDIHQPDSIRFVVVRDPFSRLFSAYVDKVLVPNSFYWKKWGINMISTFRKSPSAHALRCGNDVTFEEFVKYVIRRLHASDEHVKPVERLCAPCDVQFSVIGRMETLKWDFQYLLSLLNVHVANFSAHDLLSHVASDAIADSTFSAFEFYHDLQQCVSLYETCQRLWLKMQLRGIISEDLTFPLSEEEVRKLNASDMVHILEEARKISQDTEKLHQQKENALRNAYASISSEDLGKLIKIYELDFDLFGYDRHPSFFLTEDTLTEVH